MFRRLVTGAALLGALALTTSHASAQTPAFDHVFVVMMENQSFDDVVGRDFVNPNNGNIGRPDTPFITSLAVTQGLATLYFGTTHPSLPNYLSTVAGDFYGIHDDNASCFAEPPPGPGCHVIKAQNLVDQLEAKGLTWNGDFQSAPSAGFRGATYPKSGPVLYAQKHNPFMYFADIASNPARLAKLLPLDLDAYLAGLANPANVPNFSYLVPDQCHDMHGTSTCGDFDELLRAGDRYLSKLVPGITGSPAFTSKSALFLIWDEDDYSSNFGCCASPAHLGGGHTLGIVITKNTTPRQSATPVNHYSLLRTIEEGFGLSILGHANDVQDLSNLL